jgi:hypothetical protein
MKVSASFRAYPRRLNLALLAVSTSSCTTSHGTHRVPADAHDLLKPRADGVHNTPDGAGVADSLLVVEQHVRPVDDRAQRAAREQQVAGHDPVRVEEEERGLEFGAHGRAGRGAAAVVRGRTGERVRR